MIPTWEWKAVLSGVGLLALGVALLDWKGGRGRRGLAFALAWLVPGAGHILLGRWKKGCFLFSLLGATYVFGLWITGFRVVSFDDNPYYYVGQYGSGITYLLACVLGRDRAYPRLGLNPNWHDPGLLYLCVVGLLNLVILLNVLGISREGDPGPQPPPAPVPTEPRGGEAPAPAPPAKE